MTENQIKSLINSITKQNISVSVLSDESSPCVVSDFLSTGCYVLDCIMGGGLPLGRIVEIYGDTSTGKSLIAAQACASVQNIGGLAVYIDTETAVSLPIMQAVGVNVESLIYLAPDTVEDVFLAMETVIESMEDIDSRLLIVWDSIAATSSEAEMDKATGKIGYLTHARTISQGLRKLARLISRQKVAVLFLNQSKTNIGVMFGERVATFGGKSVGFHSSVRVELKIKSTIKDKAKREVGVTIRARVTKNKIAPPFRRAELPIYFGHGIDDAEAALNLLLDTGEVGSRGGWYSTELDGKEQKFRKDAWKDLYQKHQVEIRYLVETIIMEEDLI